MWIKSASDTVYLCSFQKNGYASGHVLRCGPCFPQLSVAANLSYPAGFSDKRRPQFLRSASPQLLVRRVFQRKILVEDVKVLFLEHLAVFTQLLVAIFIILAVFCDLVDKEQGERFDAHTVFSPARHLRYNTGGKYTYTEVPACGIELSLPPNGTYEITIQDTEPQNQILVITNSLKVEVRYKESLPARSDSSEFLARNNLLAIQSKRYPFRSGK